MLKKILIAFLGLILLLGGYSYWAFSSKKTLITPFPYSLNNNALNALASELPEAQKAKILIVGDRMALALNNYTTDLSAELGRSFKNPPQVYNWAKPHEGLHRTLFKLKSLKKFPSIIIYHGASSELFEKTFEVSDQSAIFKNFSRYDDDRIISLIITFPWLSKLLYQKTHYIELGPAIKEYQNRLPGIEKMKEKEISFKLFDYELRELIDLIKEKKSNLVLITTPLNLEIRPKEICSSSATNAIVEAQQEIDALIQKGNAKAAYPKAADLAQETYSNALSFYLLGKAALGQGDLRMAREAFHKATVFDCANWRGNAVTNAIMKSHAQKRQVALIDFDQFMASSLSKEGLFIDELYPQNIFYQSMMSELKEVLKKILSVND
jgi:hypothetical protein